MEDKKELDGRKKVERSGREKLEEEKEGKKGRKEIDGRKKESGWKQVHEG